jgi:hypothetical protein
VRGNYATLNPIERYGATTTFTNGNLEVAITSGGGAGPYPAVRPTINPFNQGAEKYYSEITIGSKTSSFQSVGANTKPDSMTGSGDIFVLWRSDGVFVESGVSATRTGTGVSYTNGDIIGVAYNNATLELKFYKNNSLVVTWAFTTIPASFNIYCGTDSSTGTGNFAWNFGQRPFAYTAPSGFKALCTTNLPEPTIADGSTAMDVKLYTGNGSTQTISGLNFSPDLVWIKNRTLSQDHMLQDQVRGATAWLSSNRTDAENTNTSSDWFRAFTSDGFTVAYQTTGGTPTNEWNASGSAYVAWTWDAGSSTVTNTEGSITSQVRANASAGFSIITFTGTGANGSIGHGLNAKPGLIIAKSRSAADNWFVYHSSIGANGYIMLNSTSAADTSNSTVWQNVEPTSSVFYSSTGGYNDNGVTLVAYAFSPVAGYSSAFSYTGNGSSDGPYTYLGFRSRFIIIKRTDTTGDWLIYDTARDSYNTMTKRLYPNLSNAEADASDQALDVTANGFKVRANNANFNASGGTYIGFAFAESPFQYARAR